MARIRMAYIGGGSTRGAGTMASFIHQGENFDGSEVVLIDLDPERLDLIRRLSERMAKARGLDIKIEATTDRRAGLTDCDAILSSYRPGGFAARVLDEKIPLKHGIIGQETQGPGGFFMALRAIHAMQGILADVEDVCPGAKIFNYTNPVNVLAQAVTRTRTCRSSRSARGRSTSPTRSRGQPISIASELETVMVGPQPCLLERRARVQGRRRDAARRRGLGAPQGRSRAHRRTAPAAAHRGRDGRDPRRLLPVLLLPGRGAGRAAGQADDARRGHPRLVDRLLGALRRAGRERRPAARPEVLARRHPRARARDRRPWTPSSTQGRGADGQRPEHRRGAARVRRDARRRAARPLRRPDGWIEPLPVPAPLPRTSRGLVHELGEYQALAADAAWSGTRRDADPCARRAPADDATSTAPSASTTSSRTRTASTCPRACCP